MTKTLRERIDKHRNKHLGIKGDDAARKTVNILISEYKDGEIVSPALVSEQALLTDDEIVDLCEEVYAKLAKRTVVTEMA